jgi:hypothetical protein
MPVTLTTPVEPVILQHAKVAAFKVEVNRGLWIEIWIAFGSMVEGTFVEHIDPVTMEAATPRYIKIENGFHPLVPGRALKKCPSCGLWWGAELTCSCGAELDLYDGMTRLCMGMSVPPGDCLYQVIASALYSFLTSESVPDPVTGEEVPLLDGGET